VGSAFGDSAGGAGVSEAAGWLGSTGIEGLAALKAGSWWEWGEALFSSSLIIFRTSLELKIEADAADRSRVSWFALVAIRISPSGGPFGCRRNRTSLVCAFGA